MDEFDGFKKLPTGEPIVLVDISDPAFRTRILEAFHHPHSSLPSQSSPVIVVSVPTPGLSATILEGARDALRMKRPHLTDIKTYAPQEEYPASPKSKVPHHVQQLNDRERRRRWRK